MNKKLASKLIKFAIAALLCCWVGVGIRLIAFALPTSHFWQVSIAAIIAVSIFVWIALKINKNS